MSGGGYPAWGWTLIAVLAILTILFFTATMLWV